MSVKIIKLLSVSVIVLLTSCSSEPIGNNSNGYNSGGDHNDGTTLLAGSGYVHYHLYPDSGICYKGEVNFQDYNKMIAAVSPSIHTFFGEKMGVKEYYVRVSLMDGSNSVVVAAIDKGGVETDNFFRREQHIMDISEEAFTLLDSDGSGKAAGRIYVNWEIFEKID